MSAVTIVTHSRCLSFNVIMNVMWAHTHTNIKKKTHTHILSMSATEFRVWV